MKQTYNIKGMTCKGCKASVEKYLNELKGVNNVIADLDKGEVQIDVETLITTQKLQSALPEKYTLSDKNTLASAKSSELETQQGKSKLKQLKPLFLILFYLVSASVLLHYKSWSWTSFMLDFMGLFFIVFSFFKMLDLKGFPESFSRYDPLAKKLPVYGKIYPFIETVLGLMFLMRFEVNIALISTLVLLGTTTIGVTKTLLDKKSIECACLGTTLNLPMTEATFIENAIMIVMAVLMLLNNF